MTYTVLAHCPRTQRIGIGIATFSLAVGTYCDGMKSNIGASITQAYVRHRNNQMAIKLLETGFTSEHVVNILKSDDADHAYRQIAVIDRKGEVAAYSGEACLPWAGHIFGPGMISFGNGLQGVEVAEAIRDGFFAHEDEDLELRLITALEAGRDAGGQGSRGRRAPERSAALVVIGQNAAPDTTLRVDLHDTAVEELRRLYTTYVPYQKYYRDRDARPREALRQDKFMATLKQPAA